jgi:phosphate-selective porin O/P
MTELRAVRITTLLLVAASALAAQTPSVRIAGRVQAQFSTGSGDSTDRFRPDLVSSSGFEIRRLRLQADVRLGENVTMALAPSFEMSQLRLRDAWLRIRLWHDSTAQINLTMGQEKKPFNRYEWISSNTLPSIERSVRIRGLTATQLALGAQNNILEYNGYIAHDIGANVDGSFARGRLAAKVGVYNGTGESQQDVNDAKSYGARATATLLQDAERRPLLRVGAAFFSRDRAVFRDTTTVVTNSRFFAFYPDSSHRSTAWEADLEWGDFRPGPHLIADFATGEHLDPAFSKANTLPSANRNFGNVIANAPDSAYSTFASVQAVGAWRFMLADPGGTRLIKGVEPALRVDVTDPNVDRGSTTTTLVTPALSVYFNQTTILRLGLDLYRYRDAAGASQTATAFRAQWQANF